MQWSLHKNLQSTGSGSFQAGDTRRCWESGALRESMEVLHLFSRTFPHASLAPERSPVSFIISFQNK